MWRSIDLRHIFFSISFEKHTGTVYLTLPTRSDNIMVCFCLYPWKTQSINFHAFAILRPFAVWAKMYRETLEYRAAIVSFESACPPQHILRSLQMPLKKLQTRHICWWRALVPKVTLRPYFAELPNQSSSLRITSLTVLDEGSLRRIWGWFQWQVWLRHDPCWGISVSGLQNNTPNW